jgi:hypothetical protein
MKIKEQSKGFNIFTNLFFFPTHVSELTAQTFLHWKLTLGLFGSYKAVSVFTWC